MLEAAMNPSLVGLIVFACTLGGALLGNALRGWLPADHLDGESRDTMRAGIGLIATMSALVLGLVTASARNSFDMVDRAVEQTAMDVLTLDRLLSRYGPETGEVRAALKQAISVRMEMLWPSSADESVQLDPIQSGSAAEAERLADAIQRLDPRDAFQRSLKRRATGLVEKVLETRWMMTASGATSVSLPFLVVLVFWLTITFASFGLFAPRNATVLAVLLVCAMSVGSAVFLILELDGPFEGLIRVPSSPFEYVRAHLAQ